MFGQSAAASIVPTYRKFPTGYVTTGLVQYIDPFYSDIYGTTAVDLSTAGNNATINGGMNAAGTGWALGTNKYLTLGLPNFDLDNSFTSEVWMYLTTDTAAQLLAFVSKYASSGFRRWGFGQAGPSGADSSRVIMVSTLTFDFSYGAPITYNTWCQWVFSMGPSTYTLYRNGVPEITNSRIAGSLNTGNTSDIVAGGPFGTVVSQYFSDTTRMGLTRLYTTELTSTEVLQNYNANKSDYGL